MLFRSSLGRNAPRQVAERKARGLRASKAYAELTEQRKSLVTSCGARFGLRTGSRLGNVRPPAGSRRALVYPGFFAMKVTIERSVLLKALGHVHRIVERRNTIPILAVPPTR